MTSQSFEHLVAMVALLANHCLVDSKMLKQAPKGRSLQREGAFVLPRLLKIALVLRTSR